MEPAAPPPSDALERRRQLGFTVAMAAASVIGVVALTFETRWISALGPTQLQAYSVGHSACFYMSPLSSLWAGVTAKVGRAVGENDDAEISRLLRMTAVLVGGTAALTWVVYLPFGRWLLEDVYEADAEVLPDALAYLRIKTLGEWTVEYAADAGGNVLQGLQELRLTVAISVFEGCYTWLAEWFVLVNRRWPVPFDAALHFSREALLAAFVLAWLRVWLRRHAGRHTPWSIRLRRSDWWRFLRDSFFLLLAGYVDLTVSSVAGILTARLSATDASANHIVARVQSFPSIFNGALAVAATTLGSRYLGERQQRRFVQMATGLLAGAALLAVLCGVGMFLGAASIFRFFTDDLPTLAALQPTAMVLPFCIGAGLLNAVAGGLVLAAQEFHWQSISSAVALLASYLPMLLVATESDRTSVASLLLISTAYTALSAAVRLGVVCVMLPRRLRGAAGAANAQPAEEALLFSIPEGAVLRPAAQGASDGAAERPP